MSRIRPICLSIAGFDPSGGAGILADVKSFEQIKTLGLAVQTCNTVQVEDKFERVVWTPQELILEQLNLILNRYELASVKIGLIENSTVLLAVLEAIRAKFKQIPIIWDPVLKPSFQEGEGMNEARFSEDLKRILEYVSIITPNAPEYLKLIGLTQNNTKIYLKGGHQEIDLGTEFQQKEGRDFLITSKGVKSLNAQGKAFLPKHGTGCILSAALAAYMARGFGFHKASVRAKTYVYNRAKSNASLLAYHNNG